MLRKSFLVFIAVFMIVFIPNTISNLAQISTQQSNSETRPFTNLELEITSSKKSLLPLQPIPIVIKQNNKTNRPVLGYESIGFNKSPLFLYAQKIGHTEKISIENLTALHVLRVLKNTEIAPGDSRKATEWLTLDLNKYFSEPGVYQLQMVLMNPDATQKIESNLITIEIQEPVGEDREVYNLIKNSSMPEAFFSGVDFSKIENTIKKISEKFPNSEYAKSSNYLLGQASFARKQYSKALIYLLKLENDKDFVFAEKIKKQIDEIREKLKDNNQ